MPMNLRASYPGAGRESGVDEDIARITAIWEECRTNHGAGGDLLFGQFTIADAFYAPIVSRFLTYGVSPGGIAGDYMDSVWALPAMQDWAEKARAEEWKVERYDHSLRTTRETRNGILSREPEGGSHDEKAGARHERHGPGFLGCGSDDSGERRGQKGLHQDPGRHFGGFVR
jgi:hypothetical protein